jgi:hypothetical protein
MYAISNAFFLQAEVVQKDRWSHGPLEIIFVQEPREPGPLAEDQFKFRYELYQWNQTYAAGLVRPGDVFEAVTARVRGIERRQNPNIIFAPVTPSGVSELHVMLASLLPDSILKSAGLKRPRANISLTPTGRQDLSSAYSASVERAFEDYIWSKIMPRARNNRAFFSRTSPLRLLAGDTKFWMHRIYRIALERRESCFEPTRHEDEDWEPLDKLRNALRESLPTEDRAHFDVRRPLMGGPIWMEDDADEREAVIEDALSGAGIMDSLAPVIELVNSRRAHEDFSSRASWIKEDFERAFYSKRSRLKVELVETVDDAPVWTTDECDGYGDVLYRDLLAALDLRERTLFLALRMGRTVTEIAAREGLSGHAGVSRRIKALKAKIAGLLH